MNAIMKNTPLQLLSLFIVLCTTTLFAQDDCDEALTAVEFSENQLEQFTLQGYGLLDEGLRTRLYSEDSTLVNVVFASSLWIGGETASGEELMQSPTYGIIGPRAIPGPLNPDDAQPFTDVCQAFDRFWFMTSSNLALFLEDFQDNGVLDNEHLQVMSWPGRSNPFSLQFNGIELPDVPLAPFVDHDGDGLYNPAMGDYPQVKGDQIMWWMYSTPGVFPLQYSNTCYAFAEDLEAGVLDKTVYFELSITSFLEEPIVNTRTALFVDADIGCYTDDYVGCFPEANLAFAYNKDAVDGLADSTCIGGVARFQEEIPVLGIKLLEGPVSDLGEPIEMTSFSAYVSNGVGSPPPQITKPNNFFEFYNYLSGLWRDGTPYTIGDLGYSGTETTSYLYPGNPANDEEWSLCSINGPTLDYRMLLGSGDFQFDPGETIHLGYAFFLSDGYTLPCPDLSALMDDCSRIMDKYQQLTAATWEVMEVSTLHAFPNPTTGNCRISLENKDDLLQDMALFNSVGKRVINQSNIGHNQVDLPMQHLPKGIYYYQIQTKNHRLGSGKIILTR